jgi:uncharacterized delta-60 repeat protein
MAGTPMGPVVFVMLAAGLTAASALAMSATGGARRDPTFGRGRGWVTTRIAGATAVAYGAAVVQGGKIVVAGQASTPTGNAQVLVARYARDGRLDRSFGSSGIFKTGLPAAAGPFIATSVVQDKPTRKLLIAGGYGQGSMLVMRLTPNGRLDRTFGRNRAGRTTIPVGGVAQSIAIQPGGGILVGGSNANRNGRPMVVARLTRNGVLDRRFGRGGLAQVLFWNPDLAASAGVVGLAMGPHGGVIASGHLDYIGSDGHGSAGVFRLSRHGRLVRRFGSGGHVEIAFRKRTGGFAQWFPCAMTVDSRGRISVSGDGSTGGRGAILSARLIPRGVPDRSFGKARNGRVVIPGASSDSDTTCGATSSASGSLTVGVGSTLVQLRADGAPNDRFARGGLINIARPRHVNINAVERSGPGRVVVAGFAANAVYVARYLLPTRS